jgi:hypothetical protein
MGLSLSEAMALTGKSRSTLFRYRADGCDISDPESLRQFSDHADLRARGRAANLLFDRPATVATGSPSFPGNSQQALAALDTLAGLKAAFQKRLDKAKKVGDELESGLLAEELRNLTESHRLLDITLEGYQV